MIFLNSPRIIPILAGNFSEDGKGNVNYTTSTIYVFVFENYPQATNLNYRHFQAWEAL